MEITVKAKNRKDEVKAFLLEKEVKKWLKKNDGMFNDYMKLADDCLFFKMKWGIPIEIVIGEAERPKSRWIGVGV